MRDSEMEMDSNSSPWHPNLELLGGQVLYSALNYLLSSPGAQCKHVLFAPFGHRQCPSASEGREPLMEFCVLHITYWVGLQWVYTSYFLLFTFTHSFSVFLSNSWYFPCSAPFSKQRVDIQARPITLLSDSFKCYITPLPLITFLFSYSFLYLKMYRECFACKYVCVPCVYLVSKK